MVRFGYGPFWLWDETSCSPALSQKNYEKIVSSPSAIIFSLIIRLYNVYHHEMTLFLPNSRVYKNGRWI
jgi:hypothetical protein